MIDFDRVYGGVFRFPGEAPWSARLARRLLSRVPAREETICHGRAPTVGDARGSCDIVFVCADPEALVPEIAQRRLVSGLSGSNFDLLFPVSNEAEVEELKRAPAFSYLTPSDLDEVAAIFASAATGGIEALHPTPGPSPQRGGVSVKTERGVRSTGGGGLGEGWVGLPVYATRRSWLSRFPAALPLSELPEQAARAGGRLGADPGAYVHRYAPVTASERTDLIDRIPAGARRVLDVGCARGGSAAALRRREIGEIVGIEPDTEDAAAAANLYDRIVNARLDEVAEAWDERFDAILFGDVLEHLEDPALALLKVRPWLSPRGLLVASVPNFGNASILADLLRGRFDYVPYSLLSGTHLRFFTRQTLTDLFEACGYEVVSLDAVGSPPAPRAAESLEKLRRLPGASGDLAASELITAARRA